MNLKEEVLNEVEELFHKTYSGVDYPKLDYNKIQHFVEKALNNYETKLYYRLTKNKSSVDKYILTEELRNCLK